MIVESIHLFLLQVSEALVGVSTQRLLIPGLPLEFLILAGDPGGADELLEQATGPAEPLLLHPTLSRVHHEDVVLSGRDSPCLVCGLAVLVPAASSVGEQQDEAERHRGGVKVRDFLQAATTFL